jgi:hypothetical protein
MMPRQNRVQPDGQIIISSARGTLMGNRGCLHNDQGKIVRQHQRKAWITCLLEFKGRKRALMSPGQYTELFFLDEATALAAGHRPCNECRPANFIAFKAAWLKANLPGQEKLSALDLDAALHRERTSCNSLVITDIQNMPTGTMVQDSQGVFYLVRSTKLLQWSPDGYRTPVSDPEAPFRLVTPPSLLKTLQAGYEPQLHPTATKT